MGQRKLQEFFIKSRANWTNEESESRQFKFVGRRAEAFTPMVDAAGTTRYSYTDFGALLTRSTRLCRYD
jgi:hypothetical protein